MNTKRWSIHYAYATSTHAEELGCGKTGCYFIAEERMHKDGCWGVPYICPKMYLGFVKKDDPDMLAALAKLREGA